ncbi:hypothetical protein ACJRO7_028447 [Eucalyptus globulus]|uniref:Phytosulfokine n=1 Tax=Eucalyptus globulus TaxID=34317 RepID=A0ABD3JY80_EUCGL
MAKSSSVLTVINALLILLSLSAKLAEAVPVFTSHDGQESVPSMPASQFQLKPEAEEEWDGSVNEEACGVAESEECLMRRALADDHLDYIYTQDIKS